MSGHDPERRRRAHGAVVRRHLVTLGLVAGLAALLLFSPKIAAGASSQAARPGITPPAGPGTPGTTVAGVACAPGVRQVPWSAYAPACIPAWHGHNGGATANGVTATTITLVYRLAATNELQELYALIPPTTVGTNDEAVHTMQAYVNTFNRYFELYGRKVVLRPYNGQGNFITEDTGSGLAQAQADALTVSSTIHGFADMSLVDSSVVYTAALEARGVASFGLYLQDASWYRQAAPYQYTTGPNCTKGAGALGTVLGTGMSDQPAAFAGDSALRATDRVYGVVYPDNSTATACAQQLETALAAAHHASVVDVGFTFDPASLVQSSADAVAQLRSHGVTTIICSSCDPITPVFLLQAAHAEGYHPEWVFQSYFAGNSVNQDSFVRNELAKSGASDEASGILAIGTASVPRVDQEAIRAYELGNGGSTSGILPSYPFVYGSMLYFFDLLQAAGPDLSAQGLHAALADTAALVPSKPGGQLGGWAFGPGTVDPASDYQILRWSPTATSAQDGQQGAFVACDGGKVFGFASAVPSPGAGRVPVHSQPACPS